MPKYQVELTYKDNSTYTENVITTSWYKAISIVLSEPPVTLRGDAVKVTVEQIENPKP